MSRDAVKDFFISYNQNDNDWAEWIAWTLEDAGYKVVIQAWDFRVGQDFIMEMQKAVSESQRTIAVLSEYYLNAEFTQPEWAEAFARDPKGENRLLIPIRVGKCRTSGLLATRIYTDLVGLAEEAARTILLTALHERGKPHKPPSFPVTKDEKESSAGGGQRIQKIPSYPTPIAPTHPPDIDETIVKEHYTGRIRKIAALFRKHPDLAEKITVALVQVPEKNPDQAAFVVVAAVLKNFVTALDKLEELLCNREISSEKCKILYKSILGLSVRQDFVRAMASELKSEDRKIFYVPVDTHTYTTALLQSAIFDRESDLTLDNKNDPYKIERGFDLDQVISGPGADNKKNDLLRLIANRLEFDDEFLNLFHSHLIEKTQKVLRGLRPLSSKDLQEHLTALWRKGKPIYCVLDPEYHSIADKMSDYSLLFFQRKVDKSDNINEILLTEQATISVAIDSFTKLLEESQA